MSKFTRLSPYNVNRVVAYIQEHLSEKILIPTLATLVGQKSEAAFARAFMCSTGCPPHRYILRCRIERAQHLLTETHLSMGLIAQEIGICDQSYFTRLFRQAVGLTPGAYRAQRKEQPGLERQTECLDPPSLGQHQRGRIMRFVPYLVEHGYCSRILMGKNASIFALFFPIIANF